MFKFLKKRRCCLCGRRDLNTGWVRNIHVYDHDKFHYHKDCVEEISGNPTAYTHLQVDKALSILQLIDEFEKKILYDELQHLKKCTAIKEFSLEDEL